MRLDWFGFLQLKKMEPNQSLEFLCNTNFRTNEFQCQEIKLGNGEDIRGI